MEQQRQHLRRRQAQARGLPPSPQFFRILLPGFSQRLTIPQAFRKHIVGDIQGRAFLVGPVGGSWAVAVHRETNSFYFKDGWREFSEAHGLTAGCFLLFRYDGGMVFTVTVFDQTLCMKEYSPAGREGGPSGALVDAGPNAHVEQLPNPGYERRVDMPAAGISADGPVFEININSFSPLQEPILPLPKEFSKFATELGDGGLARIFSSVGKCWHIKIREDSAGFYLADGWQGFAAAHRLRRGDSLVFKHEGALVFVVSVVHDSKSSRPERSRQGDEKLSMFPFAREAAGATSIAATKVDRAAEHRERRAAEVMDVQVSGKSCFQVVLDFSARHRRYGLRLPAAFVASNGLSARNRLLLRDPEGRSWPLKLRHSYRHCTTVHAGWRRFCLGNKLRSGDVCLFEYRKEQKEELRVKIRRRSSCQTSGKPAPQGARGKETRSADTTPCTAGMHFTCTITPSKRLGAACPIVPASFTVAAGLSSVRHAILVDPEARRWPVNVYHLRAPHRTPRVSLGCGWRAFCAGNGVEVGDRCNFGLESRTETDAVFSVGITKHPAAGPRRKVE